MMEVGVGWGRPERNFHFFHEKRFNGLCLCSEHRGHRRRHDVVRDVRAVHDIPAQVLVDDQPRNIGLDPVSEYRAGVHIPESDHVRRYRQRVDLGKYQGDGVAG